MLFKKLSIITALILLFETPVFACYGTGCSTYIGGYIYNAPWNLYNKTVPPVVTNPVSILDNPQKYLNYSVSANNNGQVFQTVSTKKGNSRIKVKVNSKF